MLSLFKLCWDYRRNLPCKIKSVISGKILRTLHPHIFSTSPIVYGPHPKITGPGNIKFGKRCVLRSFRLVPHICALEGAVFEMGDNGYVNDGVNICASLSIKIGHSAKIGDMVYIYDTDFHSVSPDRSIKKKPITIGNNVWIGGNCTVLAGADIGDYAVIGAGSVVTGCIPANCVAAGTPARVMRTFDVPDGWERK